VVRTGDAKAPVSASIVYISDLNNVIYAKPKSGFGSAELGLDFTNGQLTKFGQKTDTKVPEHLGALAGLLTARAGASKTEAEAAAIIRGMTEQSGASWVDIGKKLTELAQEGTSKIAEGLKGLSKNELKVVGEAVQVVTIVAKHVSDPANSASAKAELDKLEPKLKDIDSMETDNKKNHDLLVCWARDWARRVRAQVALASDGKDGPAKPALDDFELYEIIMDGKGARLNRVG